MKKRSLVLGAVVSGVMILCFGSLPVVDAAEITDKGVMSNDGKSMIEEGSMMMKEDQLRIQEGNLKTREGELYSEEGMAMTEGRAIDRGMRIREADILMGKGKLMKERGGMLINAGQKLKDSPVHAGKSGEIVITSMNFSTGSCPWTRTRR